MIYIFQIANSKLQITKKIHLFLLYEMESTHAVMFDSDF